MATKHATVKDALFARLALILQSGGYNTDAGLRVFLRDEYKTQPPEMPCLLVAFGDRNDTIGGEVPPSQGEENHLLQVTVSGVISDNERGDSADAICEDIINAINVDRWFGGITEGIEGSITSSATVAPSVRQNEHGEQVETGGFVGSAIVTFTIFYVTAYGSAN